MSFKDVGTLNRYFQYRFYKKTISSHLTYTEAVCKQKAHKAFVTDDLYKKMTFSHFLSFSFQYSHNVAFDRSVAVAAKMPFCSPLMYFPLGALMTRRDCSLISSVNGLGVSLSALMLPSPSTDQYLPLRPENSYSYFRVVYT